MKTDLKKSNAETMSITRNIRDFDKHTDNIYESVVIMSKRADQISIELKEMMKQEVEEMVPVQDNLEEVNENRELIELAKSYERLPKPTLISVKEFEDDKIHFKLHDENEENA